MAALAVICALCSGCQPESRTSQPALPAHGDLSATVILTESFIREQGDPALDLDELDSCPVAREMARHRYSGAVLLGLMAVSKAASCARGTTVCIRPRDADGYVQQLYWGRNRIYMPGCFRGKFVFVIVESRGSYSGVYAFALDFTTAKVPRVKL